MAVEENPFLETLVFGSLIISAFGDSFVRQLWITYSFFVTQTLYFLSLFFFFAFPTLFGRFAVPSRPDRPK